jgi:hypothetical protein
MATPRANVTPTAMAAGGKVRLHGDYDTGLLTVVGRLDALTADQWADLKDAGDSVLTGMDAVRDGMLTEDPDPGQVPDSVIGTPFPGRHGYVTGTCGHAVAGSEWNAGYRKCERC